MLFNLVLPRVITSENTAYVAFFLRLSVICAPEGGKGNTSLFVSVVNA